STFLGSKTIKGAEMDFEIKLSCNDYIAIEVKSSKEMQKFTSFEIQLNCKLELMVQQNKIPKEFHIVVYTANEREYKSSNFLLDELKKAQKIINNKSTSITVKVFKAYIKIRVNTKIENPYTNFMQEGINDYNYKEIKL
ncbi:MAG: hypothetical protein L6407_05295, partial [Candidatus Delongbacteria bacterium]|nr:hypothetical protein [Candidatus Delongbacteria bacterium]